MAEVGFLPLAEAEYTTARSWYGARSPQAAQVFEAEVIRAVERIGTTPTLYALEDRVHRLCPVNRFSYVLAYRIEPSGDVLVVAVAHTSRASESWRGR